MTTSGLGHENLLLQISSIIIEHNYDESLGLAISKKYAEKFPI